MPATTKITIQCSGCQKPFEILKGWYESKSKWGQKEFYHSSKCRQESRRKNKVFVA